MHFCCWHGSFLNGEMLRRSSRWSSVGGPRETAPKESLCFCACLFSADQGKAQRGCVLVQGYPLGWLEREAKGQQPLLGVPQFWRPVVEPPSTLPAAAAAVSSHARGAMDPWGSARMMDVSPGQGVCRAPDGFPLKVMQSFREPPDSWPCGGTALR